MTRTLRILLVLCCAALGSACATSVRPQATPEPGKPYRVGPPDMLSVTILPEPVIQRSVTVRPDGMISIDLVGDIPAAGRTTEEIAADIAQRISRFKRDASVTVALQQALSPEITILGEVGRPSTFPLSRETRLVEAIGLVGGPRPFAAKSRIRVIRFEDGKTRIYRVNLNDIEKGDLSSNILLQGGDIVVVPPTIMARVGYTLQGVFFPIGYLLGMGGKVTTTVVTGGMNRAVGF